MVQLFGFFLLQGSYSYFARKKKIALCGLRWFKLYVSRFERCQMSNSQTFGLQRRFTKKTKKTDIMRFTHIDINFDVRYEGHQNCPKRLSMDILRVFSDHHMWHQNWRQYVWTSLCQFIFLWTTSIVQVFDFLTFDIFLTTWHLFDILAHYLNHVSSSLARGQARVKGYMWPSVPLYPHCPCGPHPLYPLAICPIYPVPIPLYPIAHMLLLPMWPIPLYPIPPVPYCPMCPIAHVANTHCTPYPCTLLPHVSPLPMWPIPPVPIAPCAHCPYVLYPIPLYPIAPYAPIAHTPVPYCPMWLTPLYPLPIHLVPHTPVPYCPICPYPCTLLTTWQCSHCLCGPYPLYLIVPYAPLPMWPISPVPIASCAHCPYPTYHTPPTIARKYLVKQIKTIQLSFLVTFIVAKAICFWKKMSREICFFY